MKDKYIVVVVYYCTLLYFIYKCHHLSIYVYIVFSKFQLIKVVVRRLWAQWGDEETREYLYLSPPPVLRPFLFFLFFLTHPRDMNKLLKLSPLFPFPRS